MYIYITMATFRNVCFTLNNWTNDEYENIVNSPKFKYLVVGKEIGEKGTPHLQGYAELKTQTRFNALKTLLGQRCHIEKRKGTAEEAAKYCKKDGNYVEVGSISRPGLRSDLEEIKDTILTTGKVKPNLHLLNNPQQLAFAEKLLKYSEVKRNPDKQTYVKWIWGPSGTGKTRRVWEDIKFMSRMSENDEEKIEAYWWRNSQGKWFDGYDGEEVLVLDDLRPEDFNFTFLLAILDRYPCKVEIKGLTRELLATTIYITSCYSPDDFIKFIANENGKQLKRRITNVTEVTEGNTGTSVTK